ncbi:MAG: response regulator, partial [Asgard group archaeon]|nr:response regulator [Asgard group archaeon]
SVKEKISILIIDDDQDIGDLFVEIIKNSGYTNVRCVGTGEEGRAVLSDEFVNIAMVDLKLPDINGMDLISQLRSISPDTEFIIVTGYGTLDTAIKAMQFDVGGYLEKPVSPDKILRTLDEVIVKHILKLENQQFLEDLGIAHKEILFLNDLLVNNVDELNQSLLLTMVQIEKLNPTPEQKKVLSLFQEAIRKNARLTRNIKKLQAISEKSKENITEVDISRAFATVVNRLRSDYGDKNFEVTGDFNQPHLVLADNDLNHMITELLLMPILNDPKPKIRINVEFKNVTKDDTDYLKVNVNAFQVNYIYNQKDVEHPTDLKTTAATEQEFQDLGPFVINSLIRFYNGFVSLPVEAQRNILDIYLPLCEE